MYFYNLFIYRLESKIREEAGFVHASVGVHGEVVGLMMGTLVPEAVVAKRSLLCHSPELYVPEDLSEVILKIQGVPQVVL